MSNKSSDSKTVLRCALILLSVVFLVTSIGVYWRFAKETDVDADITEKYLTENNIKPNEFYGTSRFQEIEAEIQAKRTSYWHTVYALPIVFSCLAAAAAAVSIFAGKKKKEKDAFDIGSPAFAAVGAYVFIVSLIRIISADFSHLYLTSESSTWRGLGVLAWVLTVLAVAVMTAAFIAIKKGISFGKLNKASGFNTKSEEDDDNIFYPSESGDEKIDADVDDVDDAEDENI